MELGATWGRATKVWLSLLWRNIIAIVVSIIASAVVGFILGFILGMVGVNEMVIRIVVMPIGVVIGLLISIVPVKMILNKNFGEFRLSLIPTEQETVVSQEQ